MTKYVMTNNQDAERFVVDCKDGTEARHWIINNVDLSKEWNIKEDNFVAKNKLDVSYRDIQDIDSQWIAMSYILDCLSDKQLKIAQKLINELKKKERN
jgi:hypothetical protein